MNISQQTHVVSGAIADFKQTQQGQSASTQDVAALHSHLQREVAGDPNLEQALTLDVVRGLAAGADVRTLLESAIGRQHTHQADVNAVVGATLDQSQANPTTRARGNGGTFQASALAGAQQSARAGQQGVNAGAEALGVSGAQASTRGASSLMKRTRNWVAGGVIAATLAMAALSGGFINNVANQVQSVSVPQQTAVTQTVNTDQAQLAGLSAAMSRFQPTLKGDPVQALNTDRSLYSDVYSQYVAVSAANLGQSNQAALNTAGKQVIDLERSLVGKYETAGFTSVSAQNGILHVDLGAADAPTAAHQIAANDASGFAKSLASALGGNQQALDLIHNARPNHQSTSRGAINDAADQLVSSLRQTGHYPASASNADIRNDLGLRTMRQLRDSPLLNQMQTLLNR